MKNRNNYKKDKKKCSKIKNYENNSYARHP